MKTYKCRHCGAQNDDSGQCIACGRAMGSVQAAWNSALVASVLLAVAWIALSWLTGLQCTVIAVLYGGLVSGAVIHFSAGDRLIEQVIATSWTVVGIAFADTVVMWLNWETLSSIWQINGPRPPIYSLMRWQLENDMITALFCILGVVGGGFVWRPLRFHSGESE